MRSNVHFSFFFFNFLLEDLKFCGSSKEGCGWAGHILTNQSCALVSELRLGLAHDSKKNFIHLRFFEKCF